MILSNRIFEAFDSICAEEELKKQTLKAMRLKIYENQGSHTSFKKAAIIMCSVFAVIFLSCLGVYKIPVSAVSIDINPSIQLKINGLDRVIQAEAMNEEGREVIESVSVMNLKYDEAVELIISCEEVQKYITDDSEIDIAVASRNQQKSTDMENGIKQCINGASDVNCFCVNYDDAVSADSFGMSVGKYRAYLQLIELYPDVSSEEAAEMSMSEIRRLINGADSETQDYDNASGVVAQEPNSYCANNVAQGAHSGHMHGKK